MCRHDDGNLCSSVIYPRLAGAPEFGSRAPTPHVLPTSGRQPATDQLDCLRLRLRTLWRPAANHAVAVSSRLADNAEGWLLGHPTQHDRGEIDTEPATEKNAIRLPKTDRSAYAVWETTYPMEISTHVAAAFVRCGHLSINQRGCPVLTAGQKPDRPFLS